MINIQENIALAPMTSFRIGGKALFYTEATNLEELKEALKFASEKKLDFYMLGGGTNLLVSDQGFAGLVIKLKMNALEVNEEMIEAQAGVPLIKLVNFSAANGLSGIEALAGIPGLVGGAVRGNAGAFGAEMKASVESVTAFDAEKMETVEFSKEACNFVYRGSVFKENKNLIVLSVKLKLTKADTQVVAQKIKETIEARASKGLHGVKSAGSFFMNPAVQNQELLAEFEKETGSPARNGVLPAGWVIDRAGLRGKTMGGAQVSEKHANYVINAGEATAEDVIMLVSYIKQQVRDQLGIQLQEEVNYLGF